MLRPGAFFRYGRGLYFSKVASKSNGCAASSERRDPHSLRRGSYRLVFLCRVAAGEEHRTIKDELTEEEVVSSY